MKHIFRILLAVLACSPAWAYAGKSERKTSYLPAIEVANGEVRKNGRNVELTMVVDLSGARIRTQHTVALTPVLVSRDGQREAAFAPVVVDGGTRNRVYLRAQRLRSVELPPRHDGQEEVVIRRRNGKAGVLPDKFLTLFNAVQTDKRALFALFVRPHRLSQFPGCGGHI